VGPHLGRVRERSVVRSGFVADVQEYLLEYLPGPPDLCCGIRTGGAEVLLDDVDDRRVDELANDVYPPRRLGHVTPGGGQRGVAERRHVVRSDRGAQGGVVVTVKRRVIQPEDERPRDLGHLHVVERDREVLVIAQHLTHVLGPGHHAEPARRYQRTYRSQHSKQRPGVVAQLLDGPGPRSLGGPAGHDLIPPRRPRSLPAP